MGAVASVRSAGRMTWNTGIVEDVQLAAVVRSSHLYGNVNTILDQEDESDIH
jgi:hypothetical protein